MILIGILAVLFYIFYFLFIKGNAWPIMFFIFGMIGGRLILLQAIPSTSNTLITFGSTEISTATFIVFLIGVLALGKIIED